MRKLTVAVIAVVAAIFMCVFMLLTARADETAPDVEWQRRLGGSLDDAAFSILQTSDGGYIFAGITQSNDGDVSGNHGGQDAWIVKLNSLGEIVWQRCFGGSDDDLALSIQQTNDGGYIFAGATKSNDGDVPGYRGGFVTWMGKFLLEYFTKLREIENSVQDVWIVKLNASGETEWQKCLGGSRIDVARAIQQTSDGGYIFAGATNSNNGDVSGNHGGEDAWIVKLNASGKLVWQRCFGGSGDDMATSIQQTNDGGYIFAGWTLTGDGDVSGNNGGTDAWIVKLNASGKIVWQRCLGGSSTDFANSIQQTNDGGYILAGNTDSNDGDVSGNHGKQDVWIVKLNESGEIVWQKCLGGSGDDIAASIQQTSDGGYIFCGGTYSSDDDVSGDKDDLNAWVVKLNTSGEIAWQRRLGDTGDDLAVSIQQMSDGGFVFAGNVDFGKEDEFHKDGGDAWIVKLAPAGR